MEMTKEAIVNALGGYEQAERLLRGEITVREKPNYPHFVRVQLGIYSSIDQILEKLEVMGRCKFDSFEKWVMEKVEVSPSKKADLVKIIPIDLGFGKRGVVELNELYERASAEGLELCPQDTALYTALQESWWTLGLGRIRSPVSFAMKPIDQDSRNPQTFFIPDQQDGIDSLNLGLSRTTLEDTVRPDEPFIFAKSHR